MIQHKTFPRIVMLKQQINDVRRHPSHEKPSITSSARHLTMDKYAKVFVSYAEIILGTL